MIKHPNKEDLLILYQMGLDCPEFETISGQQFVELDEFEKMINKKFWAAYVDNKPVGFVYCVVFENEGCIVYLVVSKEYRKQGWGKKLIEKASLELKAVGVNKIYAWVRQGSHANNLIDFFGCYRGGMFTYVFFPIENKDEKLEENGLNKNKRSSP